MRYNVQWLKGNNNLKEEFKKRLHEECRMKKIGNNDVEESWINLKNAIRGTAENHGHQNLE